MASIKTGLIQVALKGDAEDSPGAVRERMIEAHVPFIDEAAAAEVQVLCFQEVFNQPYFCPSQDPKWYAATEPVPDGPTTQLMCEYARKHGMVIVVPIYEQAMTGVYYNTAAVANGVFIGAINRPGVEAPWDIGRFYGTSYVVDPRGRILAEASEDGDELVVADMDMDMVREVRNLWQFFRDRRPEMYGDLTEI